MCLDSGTSFFYKKVFDLLITILRFVYRIEKVDFASQL